MKRIIIILSIIGIALISAGCSLTSYETEPVEISIDLDQVTGRAPSAAVFWDSLSVTGEGMEDIVYNQAQLSLLLELNNGTILIPVTSGPARTFTLTGSTASVSFTGTTTVDIDPGTTPSVALIMQVSDLNIMVPDRGNGRIVQIDDMTGTNRINSANIVSIPQTGFQMVDNISYDTDGNIYAGVYTQTPGVEILKASVIDTQTASWNAVLVDSNGSLEHFFLRPDDGIMFLVRNYGSDTLLQYTPNALGQYISSTSHLLTYPDAPGAVGSIIDIDLLDNGQLAVIGNYVDALQNARAVIFIVDFDSVTGTWSTVASLGSDVNADLINMLTFANDAILTHKGNTLYFAGTPDAGDPELHTIVYDPLDPTLTYDPADTVTYTGTGYDLIGVIPTLDDSLIFTVYNPAAATGEEYAVVQFASPADFDSSNPAAVPPDTYSSAQDPFIFQDIPY